jgi:hypothetical protein
MTQKTYSVSPKPSVRLKPGTHLPGLRPSDSGDTRAPAARPTTAGKPASTEEVCPSLGGPSRAVRPRNVARASRPVRVSAQVIIRTGFEFRHRLGARIHSNFRNRCGSRARRGSFVCGSLARANSAANQKSEIRKSEIRRLISPALYRTFLRCTAKPNFSSPHVATCPACAGSPRRFFGN